MLIFALLATFTCANPVAYDGDTVKCADGTRVRIYGIQAVEKGQPGDRASTQSLQRLVNGGIRCQTKGTSYNRVVGECYGRSGNVSRAQIRRGQAKEWCRYSRGKYGTCK